MNSSDASLWPRLGTCHSKESRWDHDEIYDPCDLWCFNPNMFTKIFFQASGRSTIKKNKCVYINPEQGGARWL